MEEPQIEGGFAYLLPELGFREFIDRRGVFIVLQVCLITQTCLMTSRVHADSVYITSNMCYCLKTKISRNNISAVLM